MGNITQPCNVLKSNSQGTSPRQLLSLFNYCTPMLDKQIDRNFRQKFTVNFRQFVDTSMKLFLSQTRNNYLFKKLKLPIWYVSKG